jgi:hypothetical protein
VKKTEALTNFFCFTKAGLIFSLFSLSILFTGILRTDLTSLLWASGFLLISCYTLLGNIFLRLAIKRYLASQPDSFNLKLPDRGVFPCQVAQAYLKIMLPAFILPGFITRFFMRLAWQTHVQCILQIALTSGENSGLIPFTPMARGEYCAPNAQIFIRDFIGFTNSSFSLASKARLTVYPLLKASPGKHPKFEVDGARFEYAPRKKRSDELLEIRKYYPGDDVRKINWKIFARFRELYLRIGEDTSLPEAKLLFIIDPTRSSLVPPASSPDYLDLVVERAGSFLLSLLEQGVEVWLSLPGYAKPEILSIERREILLNRLAQIWWQKEYRPVPLPAYKNLHVLIFAAPGSLGLESLVLSLKKTGLKTSLFFPSCPAEKNVISRASLKNAFFVPRQKDKTKHVPPWDADTFLSALQAEVQKYRKNPWRIDFVNQV